ncbi:unnamed protein product [Urochloa decumbens]|uniref:RRM domain-containing protein n=1 Tax=Urochloa decumbens TaxID=240449 RepID=A0ABC8W5W9_9POAL
MPTAAVSSKHHHKSSLMRLPENGRLFVGGIAPGTGDVDIRRHFCRYGLVGDIWLPRDRLTGAPRLFAFVQFPRPSDAGRALANQHHVINGQKVHVARAEPRQSERLSNRFAEYKPLSQRIHRVGKHGYRIGDMMKISFGPLGAKYAESESVNKLQKFGVIIDNMLIFECFIGYISEDGKECLVRWPPLQSDDKSAIFGQQAGNIIPACSLADLA